MIMIKKFFPKLKILKVAVFVVHLCRNMLNMYFKCESDLEKTIENAFICVAVKYLY